MPTLETHSRNALDGPAWRAYLTRIIEQNRLAGTSIGGRPLIDADRRQLHRWQHERALPSIWTTDSFLIRYGLHLDFFFAFAEQLGRSPWAHGKPPAWHEEDWTDEDANWIDPQELITGNADRKPVAA